MGLAFLTDFVTDWKRTRLTVKGPCRQNLGDEPALPLQTADHFLWLSGSSGLGSGSRKKQLERPIIPHISQRGESTTRR